MIFSRRTRLFLALCIVIGGPLSLNAQYVSRRAGQLKQSLGGALNGARRPAALSRQNIQIRSYPKMTPKEGELLPSKDIRMRSYSKKMTPEEASELLGVKPGAGETDINAAFREFAKRNHSDKNPGADKNLMQWANEARNILLEAGSPVVKALKKDIDDFGSDFGPLGKNNVFFKEIIQKSKLFNEIIKEMRTKSWREWAKYPGFNFFEPNTLLNQLQADLRKIPDDALKKAHELYIKNIRDLYKESYGTLSFMGKIIEDGAEKQLKELKLPDAKYNEAFAKVKELIKEPLEEFSAHVKARYDKGLKDISEANNDPFFGGKFKVMEKDSALRKYHTEESPLRDIASLYKDYRSKLERQTSKIGYLIAEIAEHTMQNGFEAASNGIKASSDSIKSPLLQWLKSSKHAIFSAGVGLATTNALLREKIAYDQDLLDTGIKEQRTRFDKQLRYDNREPRFKDRVNREKIALAESYITGLITAHDTSSGENKVCPADIDLDRAQELIDEVSQNNPNSPEITALAKRLTEEISQAKIQKALYDRTKIDQLGGRLMEHLA